MVIDFIILTVLVFSFSSLYYNDSNALFLFDITSSLLSTVMHIAKDNVTNWNKYLIASYHLQRRWGTVFGPLYN